MLEGNAIQGVDACVEQASGVALASTRHRHKPVGGSSKRCFDILLSILALPIIAFLSLPIACLVALSGGSPIYGHLRVGRNGKLFRCYKFRTMVPEAEDELEILFEQDPAARLQWLERFKLENDPRVTPFGRFLRCTGLDEVPQIWNVLRGEMSWVGPRPVIVEEVTKYGSQASSYFACRPGITGLWQICRRRETTYDQRIAFDVEYARNWTLTRDIAILCMTIPSMFAAGDWRLIHQPEI